MKATNMLNKIVKVCYKLLYITLMLVCVSLFLGIVWAAFYTGTLIIDVMLIPVMIVFLGMSINYFLARFCDAAIYNMGIVYKGNTLFAIKKTPEYYKRKKVIDFTQVILYGLWIIRFILNLDGEYMIWAILGIIIFLICAGLYCIIGISSIEKSRLSQNELNQI